MVIEKIEISNGFLDKLEKSGIRKQYLEYEKAHTYPLSQPFLLQKGSYRDLYKDKPKKGQRFWIYIHVPFCNYNCKYCFYYKIVKKDYDKEGVKNYLIALEREIQNVKLTLKKDEKYKIPTNDLYVGGGTPTYLSPPDIIKFTEIIENNFELSAEHLRTIESTPNTIDREKIKILKKLFNRFSIGVQSYSDYHLKYFSRNHTIENAKKSFRILKENNIDHVNLDFIYGLENQTTEEWRKMVQEFVEEILPESFTMYYLRYVPKTVLAAEEGENRIVGWRELIEMRKAYIDVLKRKGYYMWRPHVFRLQKEGVKKYKGAPGSDLVNHGTVIGFGPSAYSHLGTIIGRNDCDFKRWCEKVKNKKPPISEAYPLTKDDQYARTIIKSLINVEKGLDIERFFKTFPKIKKFKKLYNDEFTLGKTTPDIIKKLVKLKEFGLIEKKGNILLLTNEGILIDEEIAYFLYPEDYKSFPVRKEEYPIIINNRTSKIINRINNYLSMPNSFKEFEIDFEDRKKKGNITKIIEDSPALELIGYLKKEIGTLDEEIIIEEILAIKLNELKFDYKEYLKIESLILSGLVHLSVLRYKSMRECTLSSPNFNQVIHYINDINMSGLHFGSFAYHGEFRFIPKRNFYNFDPFELTNKEINEKLREIIDRYIKEIIIFLNNNNKSNLTDRHSSLLDILIRKFYDNNNQQIITNIKNQWELDRMDKDWKKIIFQNYLSPLLSKKQSNFIFEINSISPLIFYRVELIDKKKKVKIPKIINQKSEASNFFEISGDLDLIVNEYVYKCLDDCDSICTSISESRNCFNENCKLFNQINSNSNIKGQWHKFLCDLYDAIMDFGENHNGYEKDKWEEKKEMIGIKKWHFRDIIEFIFPFIYFQKPIVLSTQVNFDKKDGAISFSITTDPRVSYEQKNNLLNKIAYPEVLVDKMKGLNPSEEDIAIRNWISYVSTSFHILIKSIIECILRIEKLAMEREIGRSVEWDKIVRGLTHEQGNAIPPYENLIKILKGEVEVNDYDKKWNIFSAECGYEYLRFLAFSFGDKHEYDLLGNIYEIKEGLIKIWKRALYMGIFLSSEIPVGREIWMNKLLEITTDPANGIFPNLPNNVSFHKSGLKRISAQIVFMASISNLFQHFISYWKTKKYRYEKKLPKLNEDDVKFFKENIKINVSEKNILIRNKGFLRNQRLDKKTGTVEALEFALGRRFSWEDIKKPKMKFPITDEGWYELDIQLPEDFWVKEGDKNASNLVGG
ncbi:coproporphyrinogen-III oxidase family protein [Desulfobacula sp.]|uniref:Radical SAM protein n=1 Tax=Candidatus Desulfatibia vada TaxID=2841696 RepID=A0A8J6P2R7_9BACT|nr:radical SAM protein [Candidatus Desulfatibia vada]MBL6994170.1 radical SAM protein [Desulfobacula sp.]